MFEFGSAGIRFTGDREQTHFKTGIKLIQMKKMIEIKAYKRPNNRRKVVEVLEGNGFESVALLQGEGTGAFKVGKLKPSLNFR